VNDEQRSLLRLEQALRDGDLEAARFALGNPADFANARDPYMNDFVLAYAIALAPLDLVRTLLEAGADPNYADLGGFPSLFNAIDARRPDGPALVALLLEFGADVQQRGVNDYTALHHAAARDDAAAVELLLAHGADPDARTRIDDLSTPLEEALRSGCEAAVRALRAHAS
jgi:ankyrin repeat protein